MYHLVVDSPQKRAKNKGELPQYYSEDSHPAIIDKTTWELVQLEFERQKDYCQDHQIKGRYHSNQDQFPFSGRVTCGVCGSTYTQMIDDDGNKYYRCKSFQGNRGTIIEGREFTPRPHRRWSTNPQVIRQRKNSSPRQMYCKRQIIDGLLKLRRWHYAHLRNFIPIYMFVESVSPMAS